METGYATTPEGRRLDAVTGHTSYLTENSTSQYNLAAVVADHQEDVIHPAPKPR